MNRKSLKYVIVLILLMSLFTFYLIRETGDSPESFGSLLETEEANITKVHTRDGKNGDYVETTEKDKIDEFIQLVNNREYVKSSYQETRNGYNYYYDFYAMDKKLMRITGDGGNVNINGIYYDISKPISLESLTDWFNSLPVNTYK